ncbi:MAG: phage Gp37/Gp68 family protein [Acidobacteria bacterium]|nr:phage Gp37/Gp68 family protein [Acidobacteriota bacterium]
MSATTGIQWCDATWNPIRGCTRVSEGCRHCYAEAMAARFNRPGQWGHGIAEMRDGKPRWTGRVDVVKEALTLPLRWKKPGKRIFVNSISDLFHEAVPDEAIDRVFAVMALAPQHTFIVLTKRPARMRAWLTFDRIAAVHREAEDAMTHREEIEPNWPLPNVQMGVSVEDQPTADERIPDLLATPAAVRIVSAEPLLGPVDFLPWLHGIDQIIVGGESGPGARPMHPQWVRDIRDQVKAAGRALFFKQWGHGSQLVCSPPRAAALT